MGQNKLTLIGRRKLTVEDVDEIISYDDELIELYTPLGNLRIKGEELQVDEAFSVNGTVEIKGYIRSVIYSDNKEKLIDNIVSRLFR
ncbi:MAG: YabP/YqfC family sporulation protein [Ruminiclostridium sp.]|nr:YabP/YqfC family sporulation protein [Ruminiclostridium sp.]